MWKVALGIFSGNKKPHMFLPCGVGIAEVNAGLDTRLEPKGFFETDDLVERDPMKTN